MILVTGVNGQLGYDIVNVLKNRNIPHKGIDIQDLDITDEKAVFTYIAELKPTAVIHCAAYTAVDKAEDDIDICTKVNVDGTKNIANACKEINAKLMYISTDYVFPGDGEKEYEVDDVTGPKSIYGKTKLDGELVVKVLIHNYFIVRISWAFGIVGNNFINTMMRLGLEKESLNIIDDQIGSPTYTADLAPLLCDIIISEKYGTYHATNEGYCSWADFAELIMKEAKLNCRINRIPTIDYPTRAQRPLNSRMSKKSLDDAGFSRLPKWQDAVKRYIATKNMDVKC